MIDEDLHVKIAETREQHEFLTFMLMKNNGEWRCGVVQNGNTRFIAFYDLAKIDDALKEEFMMHADRWWWESGMSLPIDCFIGRAFDKFQESLSIVPKKALEGDPIGPVYSITDNYLKRIKKRRVDLINRKRRDLSN